MYPSEMKWIPSWTNWICLVFSFWLDTTSAGPTVNNATVYKKEKGKTERTGLNSEDGKRCLFDCRNRYL